MQFERLKKNHKKEIIIGGMILVCVISAITITTTRAKYKVTEDIKLASGTINYKPYDFKIMAMYKSDDKTNYTEINEIPESGYVINEEKSYCTTDNITQVKGKLYTNSNGEHVFKNLKKTDKCYIWLDKYVPPVPASTIVANIQSTAKTTTPSFSNVATTDEGLYRVSDGMYGGYSYYWRGAATTNHVIFANKCWRIVRINGDKTIRLIYNGVVLDGNTCTGNGKYDGSIAITSQVYNVNKDRSEYVGWTYTIGSQRPSNNATATASNAKTQTEAWFNNNSNFTDAQREQIADGKFCNDRNTASGNSWSSQPSSEFYYAAYQRVYTDKKPTLSCPSEDIYTLKAGAITVDEVAFAGGVFSSGEAANKSNGLYYLYNGKFYWTMSPYFWYINYAGMFYVNGSGNAKYGNIDAGAVDGTPHGIRPVINLNSNVPFNAGSDGTQNNPYIVQ